MTKSKVPESWDKEFAEFDAKSDAIYERMLVSPTKALSEHIKHSALEALELRQGSQRSAHMEFGYVDSFLSMAAAEPLGNRVRELKSQSGEWTLRIYEDLDDRDQGYIILEVSPERASEFNGKMATLEMGGQHIHIGQIENGEAETQISLSGVDMERAFSLRIK